MASRKNLVLKKLVLDRKAMSEPAKFEGGNPYEEGTFKVPNIANEDWVLLQVKKLEHRILRRTIATVAIAAGTVISAGWAVFLLWFNSQQ